MKVLKSAALSAVLALACAAGPAQAFIVNIDATSNAGTALSLVVGQQYRVEWIGVADGGAYDAANVNCLGSNCTTGWTNVLSARDSDFAGAFLPGGSTTLDIYSVGAIGTTFASALASLQAYQAGPINHYGVDINSGVVSPAVLAGVLPSPFTFLVEGEGSTENSTLVVTDIDNNRLNNQGGVSLRFTAVPEPSAWALMILGMGSAGAMLRRRRAALA